jgi:hypothetical protein
MPTNMQLWDKYFELRKIGLAEGDRGQAAREFYKANFAAMNAGAVVGWDHRLDKAAGD